MSASIAAILFAVVTSAASASNSHSHLVLHGAHTRWVGVDLKDEEQVCVGRVIELLVEP